MAVQVGGPSGRMIGEAEFDKTICYDDVATGGSFMVFNSKRDVIDIALQYTAFFAEESCGYCTPCRVGNELMLKYLKAVQEGKAEAGDLELMKDLGETMTIASRCGLGQTAANPALTSMASFPEAYKAKIVPDPEDGSKPTFDLAGALKIAEGIAGRKSSFAH